MWAVESSVSIFQSTLPMRGETIFCLDGNYAIVISIHSPHAGRDHKIRHLAQVGKISIHSPHAGRDK